SSTCPVTASQLYCPLNSPNRFYGNIHQWSMNFDEYPTPNNYNGYLNQKIDACIDLGSRSDKLQAGVTSTGSFTRQFCTPRCAFTLVIVGPMECATRRLPIQWSPQFLVPSAMTTKVDCSNLSLPYPIDAYPVNRMILQYGGSTPIPDQFLRTLGTLSIPIENLHVSLSTCKRIS
ncbi:hypothetical protein PFISCL1PPCAC_8311, partial [Pristionchus fissidentatus]